jgi:hypothetical protein
MSSIVWCIAATTIAYSVCPGDAVPDGLVANADSDYLGLSTTTTTTTAEKTGMATLIESPFAERVVMAIGPLIKGDLNDEPALVMTLTVVEAVVGHLYALLLLLTAYSDCTRPPRSRPWVTQWRFQLVVFAILVFLTELGWVELGWLLDPLANPTVCTWTPNMLLVWTVVGLFNLLILLYATWLMRWRRAPRQSVAMCVFVCILVRAQSTGIGAVVMTLTGTGPCGMLILPLLVMAVGSFISISAMCVIAPCRISRTPIFASLDMDAVLMPMTPEEEAAKAAVDMIRRTRPGISYPGQHHIATGYRGRGGRTGNGDVEMGNGSSDSCVHSSTSDDDDDDDMDVIDLSDEDPVGQKNNSLSSRVRQKVSCFGCRRAGHRKKRVRSKWSIRRPCAWGEKTDDDEETSPRIALVDLRFNRSTVSPPAGEMPVAPSDVLGPARVILATDDDDDDAENNNKKKHERADKGKELIEGMDEA